MLTRYFIAVAFTVRLLAGQGSAVPPFDEAAFRKAVHEGLRYDPKTRATDFALKHEDIAVPILVAEIKSKINDPQAQNFILNAASLAMYSANERAADAASDLCLASEALCPWLVQQLLGDASGRRRSYQIAYYAIERHPGLLGPVIAWVVDAQKSGIGPVLLAEEMVGREKTGHPIDENDPIFGRLPADAKERVNKALERVRAAEERYRNQY
jgi:hypothetical protein